MSPLKGSGLGIASPLASVGAVVIERQAAPVVLMADRSVLLLKGIDPARPETRPWWITPGGGVADGEALDAAAVREVFAGSPVVERR